MKKLFTLLTLVLGFGAFAQPSPPSALEEITKLEAFIPAPNKQAPSFESTIITAFKNGDAAKIAAFFGENVDLKIIDKENLYSKSQAEHILKGFFTSHKPTDFKIVHKGKSGQTEYMIGDLFEGEKKFRVKLNMKAAGQVKVITSLSIEE